jgi:hypothetical protein
VSARNQKKLSATVHGSDRFTHPPHALWRSADDLTHVWLAFGMHDGIDVDGALHVSHMQAGVVPYVVTKKTVFKWQEGFWQRMLDVFNDNYKEQYVEAGLLATTGGELQHLISDAATMQIIRWTKGGFGMVGD